ncbi:hypothetical protein Bca4012_052383 [Brassica carinata]
MKRRRGRGDEILILRRSLRVLIASSLPHPFFTTSLRLRRLLRGHQTFRQIPNHSAFLSSSTVHLRHAVLQTFGWNLVCFEWKLKNLKSSQKKLSEAEQPCTSVLQFFLVLNS